MNVPVLVFAYHRIRGIDSSTLPYERELISATPAQFEEQLKFLTKHYTLTNFINISESIKKDPDYSPKNLVILTFDDGYLDFYTEVFPLLKKFKGTAVVYPSTQYIESDTPIWFDQLGFALDSLQAEQIIEAASQSGLEFLNADRHLVDKNYIFRHVKSISDSARLEFIGSILAVCKRDYGVDASQLKNEMLNWEQIREVFKGGVEIGSHTVSHPILTNVTQTNLAYELTKSKELIEEKTGGKVVSLAYPVGGIETFSEAVIKEVKKAGYEFAVCYLDGVNDAVQPSMYELKRIRVEENQSLSLFRTRLALLSIKRAIKR
ncbi:MAG: polysaccharide deacetylase family protein [Pseudomonadales bacterium]|nr:polysaccharide deacetylase family protein [Pseudomonadales bacterium]